MTITKRRPRYPIYVPSKGRYVGCITPTWLTGDSVPFYLVVEPSEADKYAQYVDADHLLVLPWNGNDAIRQAFCADRSIENGGLIAVRNWIKEHATANGFARHWQIDDNIWRARRWFLGIRTPCTAGVLFAATEDFVDRYTNVAIAGLNYTMLSLPGTNGVPNTPFRLNHHVYSCTLVLNSLPNRWRIAYNDDTDMCLQVLSEGWCTVQVTAFMVDKVQTMAVKGGNTDDLYQGDGRLKMARSLERLWPGVVVTNRRFRRAQHVIVANWGKFDTPLKRRDDLPPIDPTPNEYGMELTVVKPIKQQILRERVERHIATREVSS